MRLLKLLWLFLRSPVNGEVSGRTACNVSIESGLTLTIERVKHRTHVSIFHAREITLDKQGATVVPSELFHLRFYERMAARVVLFILVWRSRRNVRRAQREKLETY